MVPHALSTRLDGVFCILDHVSRSGMLRRIRVLVPYTGDDGTPGFFHPNHAAGVLTGYKQPPMDAHKGDGLQVGGCGMDMGFHLVSTLSHAVYPDGFGCVGERCPSNDHVNGDRDYTPHMAEGDRHNADGTLCTCHRDHWHQAGDYALRHRWL